MAPLLTACARTLVLGAVAALPMVVRAVVPYQPNGSQYAIIGSIPGDQTKAKVAVNRSGGYVVWQDNVSDNSGFGISARRLDANFSGDRNVFHVNNLGAEDQENPKVVMTPDGGACFVWQSGSRGEQDVLLRLIKPDNTFATGEITVNTTEAGQQSNPVVASLGDAGLVVVWSSLGQDGSMQGLYGQRISLAGEKVGPEFQVNQSAQWNQRNPSIAALPSDRFVVSWVNETGSDVTGEFQVAICARIFSAAVAVGDEFRVNSGTNVCSAPTVAAFSSGGFLVAWGEQGEAVNVEGWDVSTRAFDREGRPIREASRVNANVFGDQFAPQLAAGAEDCLLLWTSMGQDGSGEGVYGRFVNNAGVPYSDEFKVNMMTMSRQIDPELASDGSGRFLAIWSSFQGGGASFDLFAQRFEAQLPSIPRPGIPFINASSDSELVVSWPEQAGLDLSGYLLYLDGSTDAIRVSTTSYRLTGLMPGSTHSAKLAYQLVDGRISPQSELASGLTWGSDANHDSLPDDWQTANWGRPVNWPSPSADTDGDGASNYQEFLAGTDPTSPASVLRVTVDRLNGSTSLRWNVVPGFFYQVQFRAATGQDWINYSTVRFANGTWDSVLIGNQESESYFRITLLR